MDFVVGKNANCTYNVRTKSIAQTNVGFNLSQAVLVDVAGQVRSFSRLEVRRGIKLTSLMIWKSFFVVVSEFV